MVTPQQTRLAEQHCWPADLGRLQKRISELVGPETGEKHPTGDGWVLALTVKMALRGGNGAHGSQQAGMQLQDILLAALHAVKVKVVGVADVQEAGMRLAAAAEGQQVKGACRLQMPHRLICPGTAWPCTPAS